MIAADPFQDVSELTDAEAHWFLCHSDGSPCLDGCDKAAMAEPLSFYYGDRGPLAIDMRVYRQWERQFAATDLMLGIRLACRWTVRRVSCGCCTNGCTCSNHLDVPRGKPERRCALHGEARS